jgi:hypothetical protein
MKLGCSMNQRVETSVGWFSQTWPVLRLVISLRTKIFTLSEKRFFENCRGYHMVPSLIPRAVNGLITGLDSKGSNYHPATKG